jgi:hypothetical protein
MEKQSMQTRREKMFSIIESWQENELSTKQFCLEQNISQPVFYYWMKKYKEQHTPKLEGFIPVCAQNEVSTSTRSIEILYPNGVRLLLPRETDFSVVRSLIGLM